MTGFRGVVALQVMALNDTVVQPKESAQHGFWAWSVTTV